jgi:hypothetical protein
MYKNKGQAACIIFEIKVKQHAQIVATLHFADGTEVTFRVAKGKSVPHSVCPDNNNFCLIL